MSLAERVLAFAAQAPELQTRKALSASLLTLIQEVGATKFACIFFRREQGALVIDKAISNLSRQWYEIYLARGYEASDPVFQGVIRGGTSGYWNEVTSTGVMNRAGREVMNVARENRIHFLAVGHYASERLGIQALGEHLAAEPAGAA